MREVLPTVYSRVEIEAISLALIASPLPCVLYLVNGFSPAVVECLTSAYLDEAERFSDESFGLAWPAHLQQL